MQTHRTLFLFEGIAFIVLGLLAIALPGLFTLAIELMIGWLFLFGGLIQAFQALKARHAPGFGFSFITSISSIVIGTLLLTSPLSGMLTLTILLTIFFVIEGLAKLFFAFQLRPMQGWNWLLFSGFIAFIMAAIIISGWPETAIWVIGLLVGINMLFFGASLLAIAWNASDSESH